MTFYIIRRNQSEIRSHGTKDYPRTRHPSMWVSKRDTPSGHQGHPALQKMGIKGDTQAMPATHRLHPLGITSPFDLPEDPLDILDLLLFALIWIIHILSVNSLFNQCFRNPWVNPQGNQDKWRTRFFCVQKAPQDCTCTLPLFQETKRGPGREHLPKFRQASKYWTEIKLVKNLG